MSQQAAALPGAFEIPTPRPLVNPHAPTTTTTIPPPTPPPTRDPHEYEKSIFKGPISNYALEFLKDQIRTMRGLQPILPAARKRTVPVTEIPKVPPRPNETSRIRAEMRKYRLIQRCGEFTKYFMGQHSELFSSDKPLTQEQEQALMNKAKQLNAEEMAMEKRQAEADYLKYLAGKVRTAKDYRPNRASEFRFKHIRGEPILSSNYLTNFQYHDKPPFNVARHYKPIPRWKLPPIDKEKEIWLIPQEDVEIPLHVIPKVEPKVQKRKRPPLKPFNRTIRPFVPPKPTKRPPWNYHIPTGFIKDPAAEPAESSTAAAKSAVFGAGTQTSTLTGK